MGETDMKPTETDRAPLKSDQVRCKKESEGRLNASLFAWRSHSVPMEAYRPVGVAYALAKEM